MSPECATYFQKYDAVPITAIAFIYEVCNDWQFAFCKPSDFYLFFNLQGIGPLKIKSKERLRVCYLIEALSRLIPQSDFAEEWRKEILSKLGIAYEYFYRHKAKFNSLALSGTNKEYRDLVDNAIEEYQKRRFVPQNHTK